MSEVASEGPSEDAPVALVDNEMETYEAASLRAASTLCAIDGPGGPIIAPRPRTKVTLTQLPTTHCHPARIRRVEDHQGYPTRHALRQWLAVWPCPSPFFLRGELQSGPIP